MGSEIATIEFKLEWDSHKVSHRDRLFIPRLNFWRDVLPQSLESVSKKLIEEGTIEVDIPAGNLVKPFDPSQDYTLFRSRIKRDLAGKPLPVGRYFPCGLLSEIGFYKDDVRPFRIVSCDSGKLRIDTNHPLSTYPLKLTANVIKLLPDRHQRGGNGLDIAQLITGDGPGMQAVHPEAATDFWQGDPFSRENDGPDGQFYESPKLVSHIDEVADEQLAGIHSRFFQPGMKVLDLMAGWKSHIDGPPENMQVTGLGMNRQEMGDNPMLAEIIVHDLNADPGLPFEDNSFDACICSLSVEYLTRPVDVFREVGRVLKSGAPFVVSFSDRWFDPKVVRIWTELHAFERMGLVADCFLQSGVFSRLETESVRGFPRPVSDRHFPVRRESDPVFAVWGFNGQS